MFNRSTAARPLEASHARRRAIEQSYKVRVRKLPPAPALLAQLLSETATSHAKALLELRAALFEIPEVARDLAPALGAKRQSELSLLWHEALATAVYAGQLATIEGGSSAVAVPAALLHRAGDALVLRALAVAESDHNTQLDAPSVMELRAAESGEQFARLVAGWKLPPAIMQAVANWQNYGAPSEGAREAAAVYFGHVLATELLYPDFSSPAAVDAAAAELHLNAETLEWVRGERGVIGRLFQTAG